MHYWEHAGVHGRRAGALGRGPHHGRPSQSCLAEAKPRGQNWSQDPWRPQERRFGGTFQRSPLCRKLARKPPKENPQPETRMYSRTAGFSFPFAHGFLAPKYNEALCALLGACWCAWATRRRTRAGSPPRPPLTEIGHEDGETPCAPMVARRHWLPRESLDIQEDSLFSGETPLGRIPVKRETHVGRGGLPTHDGETPCAPMVARRHWLPRESLDIQEDSLFSGETPLGRIPVKRETLVGRGGLPTHDGETPCAPMVARRHWLPRESLHFQGVSLFLGETPSQHGGFMFLTVKQGVFPLPEGFSARKVGFGDFAPLRTRACARAPDWRPRARCAPRPMTHIGHELN